MDDNQVYDYLMAFDHINPDDLKANKTIAKD